LVADGALVSWGLAWLDGLGDGSGGGGGVLDPGACKGGMWRMGKRFAVILTWYRWDDESMTNWGSMSLVLEGIGRHEFVLTHLWVQM